MLDAVCSPYERKLTLRNSSDSDSSTGVAPIVFHFMQPKFTKLLRLSRDPHLEWRPNKARDEEDAEHRGIVHFAKPAHNLDY
jgi:hypothetical protein